MVDSYAISERGSDSTKVKYGISLMFENLEAYTILNRTEDACMDVVMDISWTGVEQLDVSYTFSEGAVAKHAAGQKDGTYSSLIMLTIRGLESIGSGNTISAVPTLVSQTGVYALAAEETEAQVYLIP